jgi:MSHA biogenesis protein MshM
MRLLWRASRGIPRLINILAQKCLMLAYGQGVRQIDSRLVRLAIRDTDDASRFAPRRWWPLLLLLGCALAYGVWP